MKSFQKTKYYFLFLIEWLKGNSYEGTKRLIQEIERKELFERIRLHFRIFGFDLSDLTDDEIDAGIGNAQKLIRDNSLTLAETIELMNRLSSALKLGNIAIN